jgi:hypothetical protein
MANNTKDAGLSEVSALAVLVETLISRLVANGTSVALTQAQLTADHNAADAKTVLAQHGARRIARQNS